MSAQQSALAGEAVADADLAEVPSQTESHARVTGWQLELGRIFWLAATLLNVIYFFAGIPRSWEIATTLSPASLQRLAALGLSPTFPAIYLIILDTTTFILYMVAAIILFRRKSDERLALIAASMLVFTAVLYTAPGYEANAPIWMIATGAAIAEYAQVAFLLTFPNGRFSPRWTFWLLPPLIIWRSAIWYYAYIPWLYNSVRTGDNYPFLPQNMLDVDLYFLLVLACVTLQIRRYRRTTDPVQRQQTKWMVWGTAMAVAVVGIYVVTMNLLPATDVQTGNTVILRLVGRTVRQLALCIIPLSMLYSILRYRLWEIDLLINRTLVYVPLTSLLAGIFTGFMALTQRLFVATTGQKSDFAVVLTTLFLTSVFTPIRNEIQAIVDRRFKEAPNPIKELESFDKQVDSVADVMDPRRALRRLLTESVRAFDTEGGAVYIADEEGPRLLEATPDWVGPIKLQLLLERQGTPVGWLALGPRRNGMGYSKQEIERLSQSMDRVGQLLGLVPVAHDHHGEGEVVRAGISAPVALPLPAPSAAAHSALHSAAHAAPNR